MIFNCITVLLSRDTMYTQNECPHLKNINRKNYEKRVAPPGIYFLPQDSIEDYSPTWCGSVVTMNKTIVMLGAG